jgi:hypothetical protein
VSRRIVRSVITLLLVLERAAAQGVTTAAIEGRVVAADGSAIAGATVELTNVTNGRRWTITTRADGRFLLEAVSIGMYQLDARALGFSQHRARVALALGQRLVTTLSLSPLTVTLAPVVTTAATEPVIDPGRTGPAGLITSAMIARLPNPGRDYLSLTLLTPSVVSSVRTPATSTGSGIAVSGENRVYNTFQIDGGTHQDVYRGQLPGRDSYPRPLSFEALQEIQVLAAPFDVRFGGFVGGLVNAVTKSGTNDLHGSVFGYLSDAALVRHKGVSGEVRDFSTWQFGGTVGGPIVRDRLHYFLSADFQRRVVPDPGPLISDTAGGADIARIGISYANALRFHTLLDTLYGIEAGTLGPVDGQVPAQDLFGKVTVEIARNNHVDWSFQHLHGNRRDFLLRTRNQYVLSSFAQAEPSTTRASRLTWTSVPNGRWSNELIVGYLRQRDHCRPASAFPEVRVNTSSAASLVAGVPGMCPPHTMRQDAVEVTDNATIPLGRHTISAGAHAELLRFQDDLVNNAYGLWLFDNLDAFEAGRARLYQRTLEGPAYERGVEFGVRHGALYAQDRWSPARGVTVTMGMRLDVSALPDAVATNEALRDTLGHDTGALPSVIVHWSPRLGLNYDIGGDGHTFVRGGIGLFSGRLPYRWLSNAYRDDGAHELFLDCRGAEVPPFTPLQQPQRCASIGPQPRLSFFAPDASFPQSMKMSLGVDRRVVAGIIGTIDLLYTRAVHQLYVTDANLAPPTGVSSGEGDRPLYGTINPSTGLASPVRLSSAFGPVVRMSNARGDHSISLSAQLRGGVGNAVTGSALYSFTRARDRMSLVHVAPRFMLEGTVIDGTLEERRLGISAFEIPHRVHLAVDVRLPYQMGLSVLYAGSSGRAFTYTVGGDANADGMGVNLRQDPVYVPRDRADIAIDGNGAASGLGALAQQDSAYAQLDAFIESVPCLRQQRARLLARNSCRNPWFGTLNTRLTKAFPVAAGRSLEIGADVYNVLNLINSRWGLSRYDGLTFATDLLVLRGYDTSRGRGIYEFRLPPRGQVDDLASRWQIEIGMRYRF